MYNNIILDLKNKLSQHRFEHTMGVAYTACSLAMCYKTDFNKAFLAGLLHDCSKLKDADYLKMAKNYQIPIPEYALSNPSLLHSALSSQIARKEYFITDFDILNAISSHNFGRPDMSLLEKIVFVADYIEPNRDFDPEKLLYYRSLAFTDIDQTITYILEDTISFVNKNGYTLVPLSVETYNFYKNGVTND